MGAAQSLEVGDRVTVTCEAAGVRCGTEATVTEAAFTWTGRAVLDTYRIEFADGFTMLITSNNMEKK